MKILKKQVEKGRMDDAARDALLAHITPAASGQGLEKSDLVIEAATEDANTKIAIFKAADAAMKPGAILASNTSTIPISDLAECLKRPEQFCGSHVFNPVRRMKLVPTKPMLNEGSN